MATYTPTLTDSQIFRRTNDRLGRHVFVTPENSTNRHLSYARIVLRDDTKSAGFYTASRETGLIVLSGAACIETGGRQIDLEQHDGIYIPRGSSVHIKTSDQTDIAEFSAEVDGQYPLQVVRCAAVAQDPTLKFHTGGPAQQRTVHIVLGKNVEAGRLVLGFTYSEPGNWTSWPPHEHSDMLEEMYVYFDMPEPAFGIQLVYNNTNYPELVTVVRDGDAVLMPGGYHPNVSVPGHRIAFLWAMAAHREKLDRQFGVVNVQPGFDAGGSGLEASRK
jgi:5-deoxy-glucuronate isomerase